MWTIFLVLGLGFLVGFSGRLPDKGLRINARLQTIWLILLIFCMGVGIGRNQEIIQTLPSLGGKACLFALFAVAGSIVAVFLLTKLFLPKGGTK